MFRSLSETDNQNIPSDNVPPNKLLTTLQNHYYPHIVHHIPIFSKFSGTYGL